MYLYFLGYKLSLLRKRNVLEQSSKLGSLCGLTHRGRGSSFPRFSESLRIRGHISRSWSIFPWIAYVPARLSPLRASWSHRFYWFSATHRHVLNLVLKMHCSHLHGLKQAAVIQISSAFVINLSNKSALHLLHVPTLVTLGNYIEAPPRLTSNQDFRASMCLYSLLRNFENQQSMFLF